VEISENDLWILSYYRESELAGGLVMGRLARETDDDDLRVHLTEHCAEEAYHAWLWTQTILKVGGTPKRVAETYQTRYYAEIGMPASLLEILTLQERAARDPALSRTSSGRCAPRGAETPPHGSDESPISLRVKDRLDRQRRRRAKSIVAETCVASLKWTSACMRRRCAAATMRASARPGASRQGGTLAAQAGRSSGRLARGRRTPSSKPRGKVARRAGHF
jgi:hypothetical protein